MGCWGLQARLLCPSLLGYSWLCLSPVSTTPTNTQQNDQQGMKQKYYYPPNQLKLAHLIALVVFYVCLCGMVDTVLRQSRHACKPQQSIPPRQSSVTTNSKLVNLKWLGQCDFPKVSRHVVATIICPVWVRNWMKFTHNKGLLASHTYLWHVCIRGFVILLLAWKYIGRSRVTVEIVTPCKHPHVLTSFHLHPGGRL